MKSRPIKNKECILSRRGLKKATQHKYADNSLFAPRGTINTYFEALASNVCSFIFHKSFLKHAVLHEPIIKVEFIRSFINNTLAISLPSTFYIKALDRLPCRYSVPASPTVVAAVDLFISLGLDDSLRDILFTEKEMNLTM